MQALISELAGLFTYDWWQQNWAAFLNILMIDLVLAGDNAIIVGLAASRVAPELRAKVIFWGIAGAVILRILFAGITNQLLQIVGLTLAGGLLLLWICWKMYRQIRQGPHDPDEIAAQAAAAGPPVAPVSFGTAIFQIMVADVSMSLDNVLAVAGAAGKSTAVLVIGLAVAVILMAVASHYIAKLLVKYPWITWIGLVIILYVALDMIYDGSHEVACKGYGIGCHADMLGWLKSAIFGR
jgi:YjbE family integral membrane protein